jgi:hypothetical protein
MLFPLLTANEIRVLRRESDAKTLVDPNRPRGGHSENFAMLFERWQRFYDGVWQGVKEILPRFPLKLGRFLAGTGWIFRWNGRN